MRVFATILSLFFILLTGCSANSEPMTFSHLEEELKDGGLDYSVIEMNEGDPFFSVTPKVLKVGSEFILVYEYPTKEDLEKDASLINGDGSLGDTAFVLKSNPHYYQEGNLIVQYAGTNEDILDQLEEVLGEQIAGE